MKYKQILLTRPPTGSNTLQGGSDADPQPPLGLAYLAGVLERLPNVNVLDIHRWRTQNEINEELKILQETSLEVKN